MNEHRHRYLEVKLYRIYRIENKAYTGTPGDRAFLVHECECGKKKAFDYGEFKSMLERCNEIGGTYVSGNESKSSHLSGVPDTQDVLQA